ERLMAVQEDAYAIGISRQRAAAARDVLELRERHAMRFGAEDGQLEIDESGRTRPRPDVLHHHVVFDRRVVLHLVLRARAFRMVTPRLGEAGDATGTEHAAELAHHAGGIRDVMKRVEAEDAIDALVRQVDAASIEDEKV